MVISLEKIRTTIQSRIFDSIGSEISVESIETSTDKWGDKTETTTSTDTAKVVPYNTIASDREYQPFGILQNGETDIVVPYDTEINSKDKVTYNGEEYLVQEIEKLPYSGGNIAFVVRLRKVI